MSAGFFGESRAATLRSHSEREGEDWRTMLAETMERSAAVRLARPKSRLKASPVMVVPMKLRTPGREGGKRVSGASAEGSAPERRLAYEAQ